MIKFLGSLKDGGLVLGLGLSHANLDKLKVGRPIDIDLANILKQYQKDNTRTIPAVESVRVNHIMIFAGETELTMAHDLKVLIDKKHTRIIDRLDDPPDQT